MLRGVDVSNHQGSVDWPSVKKAGFTFAFCKTSEGQDYKDPTWNAARVKALRDAGVALGPYHYLRPKQGRTGAVEAAHAVSVAKAAGWGRPTDLRLVVDVEETTLTAKGTRDYIASFVAEVKKRTGVVPILYTYPNFWQTQVEPSPGFGCPLWIAHYKVNAPLVPKTWRNEGWTIWQYSSEAYVPGVPGKCDVNQAKSLPTLGGSKKPAAKLKPAPSVDKVKQLQRTLNKFTSSGKWVKGIAPLIEDGHFGSLTQKRVKDVKFWLGYGKADTTYPDLFLRRVAHPLEEDLFPKQMILTGKARRLKQRGVTKVNRVVAQIAPGVELFDGVPCASWIVPYLREARAKGWQGRLVSGWRSPVYSRSLCMKMCGRPSCPGKCAGLSSNHVGSKFPKGAVDVSDYARFGQIARTIGKYPNRLCNALGAAVQ